MNRKVTLFYCVMLICNIANSAVEESVLREFVEAKVRNQLGDPYLWNPANNGGYLLRFSLDLDGDQKNEDFIASTMNFQGSQGSWLVFSHGKQIGSVSLSANKFVAIREGETIILPYGEPYNATEMNAFNNTIRFFRQKILGGSIQIEEVEAKWSDYTKIREEWIRDGTEMQPSVDALLLIDYLKGDRKWKAIDFSLSNYNLSEGQYLVLEDDLERLSKVQLTPEDALTMLASESKPKSPRQRTSIPSVDDSKVERTREIDPISSKGKLTTEIPELLRLVFPVSGILLLALMFGIFYRCQSRQ